MLSHRKQQGNWVSGDQGKNLKGNKVQTRGFRSHLSQDINPQAKIAKIDKTKQKEKPRILEVQFHF